MNENSFSLFDVQFVKRGLGDQKAQLRRGGWLQDLLAVDDVYLEFVPVIIFLISVVLGRNILFSIENFN